MIQMHTTENNNRLTLDKSLHIRGNVTDKLKWTENNK
jgi:hypothetical protein